MKIAYDEVHYSFTFTVHLAEDTFLLMTVTSLLYIFLHIVLNCVRTLYLGLA